MHGDARGKFSQLFVKITEPIVFGKRPRTLLVIFMMTLFLGYQALQLKLDAGFEKQLPLGHPYIQVFKKYQQQFGGANTVLLALKQKQGDIYDPAFLASLKAATEAVFFTQGVDRSRLSSLFTPNVRYIEAVEGGFQGGNVIPADYAPTPGMLQQVRSNVAKAKVIGRLVSNDQTAAMVVSELVEQDPRTHRKLDYIRTAHLFESIRGRLTSPRRYQYRLKSDSAPLKAGTVVATAYSAPGTWSRWLGVVDGEAASDSGDAIERPFRGYQLELTEERNPDYNPGIEVSIIGFAKAVGDVADASLEVVGFFALTVLLVWVVLSLYIGSPLIALYPLACGVLAVVWECGILHLAGYGLDPFAILVPFLVLAISVSHGIQITSFWLLEAADHGLGSLEASRATYRRLVIPGITALITNVVGFGTILLIPIGIVREMAINAMFGLLAVIVCKKILLPCLLSYAQLKNPERFRQHQRRRDRRLEPLWWVISGITARPVALTVLLASMAVWAGAELVSRDLQIGELHRGVPQLRPTARYNVDSNAISSQFAIGVDVLQVIAESKANACIDYEAMHQIDRFGWHMQNSPGVDSTLSMAQLVSVIWAQYNENNPRWLQLPRSSDGLVLAGQQFPTSTGLLNEDCSAMPMLIFTSDHKAETIDKVIASVNRFIAAEPADAPVKFRLASGNVGVVAATNDVIKQTEHTVLFWLYLCIAVCVWASFRSFGSVVCVLLPLALVSVFTYAVMVFLGIGVTVATLPVAAFAAGIGVDYGIYIYSVLEECVTAKGLSLREGYAQTLHQTGKAVVVTGVALAASVCTWMLSGLQFQVDMGILLTIMFLANAGAALFLLPAFAAFLLKPKASHDAVAAGLNGGAAK